MKPTTCSQQLWRKHYGLSVCSDDGVLEFRLAPCAQGLFVERIEQRERRARVVQSAIFAEVAAFKRWCDADAERFDYPLVFQALQRNAERFPR